MQPLDFQLARENTSWQIEGAFALSFFFFNENMYYYYYVCNEVMRARSDQLHQLGLTTSFATPKGIIKIIKTLWIDNKYSLMTLVSKPPTRESWINHYVCRAIFEIFQQFQSLTNKMQIVMPFLSQMTQLVWA